MADIWSAQKMRGNIKNNTSFAYGAEVVITNIQQKKLKIHKS
jgi:hypothetical protein